VPIRGRILILDGYARFRVSANDCEQFWGRFRRKCDKMDQTPVRFREIVKGGYTAGHVDDAWCRCWKVLALVVA